MTAILRLQLDDKDPVRVNSAINQLAEYIDRNPIPVIPTPSPARTLLTANTTFYVATTGSDANPGTVGSPFLTIQHAYDVIVHTIDTAGFTVTISCASGTYTTGLFASSGWAGGGPIILDLGGGTISGSGNCLVVTTILPSALTIQNGTLTSSANYCINHAGAGRIIVGAGITFGSAGASAAHIFSAGAGSYIGAFTPYTITGGANWHFVAGLSGSVVQSSTSVTITGTPTFGTSFAFASRAGCVDAVGMTFSGSATGTRYSVNSNGIINTGGGGVNYFPGTVAGTTATGGQYL